MEEKHAQIQSELPFGMCLGKFVHINCGVIFKVKHFKTSSQSHLTWPTPSHSHSVGKGWFFSTLHTPVALSVSRGCFSACPLPAVARHKKVWDPSTEPTSWSLLGTIGPWHLTPGCLRHCTPLLPEAKSKSRRDQKNFTGNTVCLEWQWQPFPTGFEEWSLRATGLPTSALLKARPRLPWTGL